MTPLAGLIDSCLPSGLHGKRREEVARALENCIAKEIADLFFHAVDSSRQYDSSSNYVLGYVRGGLGRLIGAELPDVFSAAEAAAAAAAAATKAVR